MSTAIDSLIRDRIARSSGGWLPFAEVMELALYHPEHGYYYGRRLQRIGRGGDFYTAVSVGPLYGRLIALLAERVWRALGEPGEFAIIEQGAHDGQFMEDVFRGLESNESPLTAHARWRIIEPNPGYRVAQAHRLAPLLGDRISWLADAAELQDQSAAAFFIANELLDAFPVHVVRWTGDLWEECGVVIAGDDGALIWKGAPVADPRLESEIKRLPRDLPAGYTTEINLAAIDWARQLSAASFRGAVMIADYGLDHDELYAPHRATGTLRRYFYHQTDDHILDNLGDCDLTAHMNFSRIIEATSPGLSLLAYADQGRFLTRLAAPWLQGLETANQTLDPALLRQFHTLTHPAQMGAKFRICLFGRGLQSDAFADLVR